jgi:enoyl-[acyl-carrier-protein] reductase (NADH)
LDIPKSEIELELDRKRAEEEERLRNLEVTMAKETEKDKYLKAMIEKREKYFPLFLQKFSLNEQYTMDKLFAEIPEASDAFDTFVINMEKSQEEEAEEYSDVEDDGYIAD